MSSSETENFFLSQLNKNRIEKIGPDYTCRQIHTSCSTEPGMGSWRGVVVSASAHPPLNMCWKYSSRPARTHLCALITAPSHEEMATSHSSWQRWREKQGTAGEGGISSGSRRTRVRFSDLEEIERK